MKLSAIRPISLLARATLYTLAGFASVIPNAAAEPTASVRYEQPAAFPTIAASFGFERSHQGPTVHDETFDNFTLPRGERITEIRWQGLYLDHRDIAANPLPPNTDAWKVSIWPDDNGKPDISGEPLFTETHPSGDVVRIVVGETPLGPFDFGIVSLPVYAFQLRLDGSFEVAAGTTYWLSIVSESYQNRPAFFWDYSAGVGKPVPQGSYVTIFAERDGYFRRDFDQNQDITRPFDLVMTLVTTPVKDMDGDGMDDLWESDNGLDLGSDDSQADLDSDGAANFDEFERRSDPRNRDTDGDGLNDGVETATGIYVDQGDTGTSPLMKDSDRDGLGDALEDPSQGYVEAVHAGSDPNLLDTDGDGITDSLEFENGFDPSDTSQSPAPAVLEALAGGDLTDPEDDADPDAYLRYNADLDSNDAPGFTVEAAPFNVFDGELGNDGDEWISDFSTQPWLWVQASFDTPIILTGFTVTSSHTDPNSDPHIWAVQGSYDGVTFETIYQRNNWDEQVWTGRSQVRRFDAGLHFRPPPAYPTIRFQCFATGKQAGSRFRLGELEFFGRNYRMEIKQPNRADDGAFEFEWNSLPQRKYCIDRSTDLMAWEEIIGQYESQGATTHFRDDTLPGGSTRAHYYRVREEYLNTPEQPH